MKLFAKSYGSALLGVLLAMGAYWLLIAPAIEPDRKLTIARPEFTGAIGAERWWRELFPAGAWQVDNPTIIQNGRGVLLANTWEQVGPKTWKLQPLSMIFPQAGSHVAAAEPSVANRDPAFAEQDVWIVNADEGATIHFEEPFDLRSGSVPSVERGQLQGAISITRRSMSKAAEKPWSLRTKDLSIDRRRISTQQPVTIEWGNSVLRGRDLRVMLRGDLLGGSVESRDDASPWGPLDELELYHVDELKVDLPPGGLWADASPSLLPDATPVEKLPATLEAFCGGRFAFDFKHSTATLTNGVHLRHQLAQLPPDEFLCHKVTIQVDPPSRDSGTTQAQSIRMGGIGIREVLAVGIDSLQDYVGEKWVELKSPTLGAAARAKRLKLDLVQRRIELAGELDQPGATQSIAWMTYQGNECRSPKIEYQASPRDAEGRAIHAGWMFLQGPGELNTGAASSIGEAQVRWQKSLKMMPAETPQEQLLELLGNTLIESKSHGFMTAERLQVWLKKNPLDPPSPATSRAASSEAPPSYLLDRLLASGKTTLSAAALQAHVESLKMKMVYVPNTPPDQPRGIQLSDSAGNPMHQYVSPPSDATSPGPAPSSSDNTRQVLPLPMQAAVGPVKPGEPVIIHGESLDATVVSAGQEYWIDALTIEGPVEIHSGATAGNEKSTIDALPWRILGQQLTLATNPAGQVDLQIDGQPAKIAVAEGALEAPSIRLDQRRNLVWIDQPGEFTLPTRAMDGVQSGLSAMQWLKAPRCKWAGRMLFDGATVRIEGDIQLDGVARRADELWMLQGFCQRLDVALAEPIDLRQTGPDAHTAPPSVERLVLRDDVDLRIAQTDLLGNRQSLERIVVPHLTFHVADQKLVGGGAGWINSKFLSQGPLAHASDDQPATLQGAHLSFRDSLVAFLDRNEVVFDGKIELASGPLANWQQTIDLAKLSQLTRDQILLNCDQLKVYDTTGLSSTASFAPAGESPGTFNFQATGNVVFEGRAESGYYSGNGYRLNYEQAKDQLVLVGDGRSPALLKRLPDAQAPGDKLAQGSHTAHVNSATINIKTMAVIDLQVSQYQYDAPQPGRPISDLGPPSAQAPDPRAGASGFFQPRQ